MVICPSLLPDSIRAQICAFMSFWSKTGNYSNSSHLFPRMTTLFADIFGHIFISHWFMAAIKPIKGSAKIPFLLQNWLDYSYFYSLSRPSGLLSLYFCFSLRALLNTQLTCKCSATRSLWLASVWPAASAHVTERVNMWQKSYRSTWTSRQLDGQMPETGASFEPDAFTRESGTVAGTGG